MRWTVFSKLTMVEQSLFGLPWVLSAALLPFCNRDFAAQFAWSEWSRWLFILGGFVMARTAGMAFNRLIDRHIDAENPRTRDRTLPAGEATPFQVGVVAWASVLGFVVCCACLNAICLGLSPLVIALLWLYSYSKRVTSLCHFVLGVIQFFGPFFAWVAITDSWGLAPLLLGTAVLASIAGTDIIYALQDLDFDRRHGLYSIPVALGASKSVLAARLLHLLAVIALVQLGHVVDANAIYYFGVAAIAGVYIYHHSIIDPYNLSRINGAFFSCNAMVGLTLFFFTTGSVLWRVLS